MYINIRQSYNCGYLEKRTANGIQTASVCIFKATVIVSQYIGGNKKGSVDKAGRCLIQSL